MEDGEAGGLKRTGSKSTRGDGGGRGAKWLGGGCDRPFVVKMFVTSGTSKEWCDSHFPSEMEWLSPNIVTCHWIAYVF